MRGACSGFSGRVAARWCLAFLLTFFGGPAFAAVTEPPIQGATKGESVPKPNPDGELSIVMARGFMATDATLQGLFTGRGEGLDYVKDAQTAPGTFFPACVLSVQLVLHAGGCATGIGWYNATPGSTTPPAQDQIHTLLPSSSPACPATIDPATACCDDSDFCPLATYDTTQMPQHRWNAPPVSIDVIRNDAHYAGGMIGFVLMGVGGADGRCDQNKYSQLEMNQPSPNGQPWIGAVVYRSTLDPASYYLGFEDAPTTAQTWKGQNNASDGDFNDHVIYVKGATCAAGGTGGAAGIAGTGGTAGAGGVPVVGGGGVAGSASTGGSAATGGGSGLGGSVASGGSSAAGGTTSTGGSLATGGSISTGGSIGAGGGTFAGGNAGSGGLASGGSATTVTGSGGAAHTAGSGAAGAKSGCTYGGPPSGEPDSTFAVGLIFVLAIRTRRRAASGYPATLSRRS